MQIFILISIVLVGVQLAYTLPSVGGGTKTITLPTDDGTASDTKTTSFPAADGETKTITLPTDAETTAEHKTVTLPTDGKPKTLTLSADDGSPNGPVITLMPSVDHTAAEKRTIATDIQHQEELAQSHMDKKIPGYFAGMSSDAPEQFLKMFDGTVTLENQTLIFMDAIRMGHVQYISPASEHETNLMLEDEKGNAQASQEVLGIQDSIHNALKDINPEKFAKLSRRGVWAMGLVKAMSNLLRMLLSGGVGEYKYQAKQKADAMKNAPAPVAPTEEQRNQWAQEDIARQAAQQARKKQWKIDKLMQTPGGEKELARMRREDEYKERSQQRKKEAKEKLEEEQRQKQEQKEARRIMDENRREKKPT